MKMTHRSTPQMIPLWSLLLLLLLLWSVVIEICDSGCDAFMALHPQTTSSIVRVLRKSHVRQKRRRHLDGLLYSFYDPQQQQQEKNMKDLEIDFLTAHERYQYRVEQLKELRAKYHSSHDDDDRKKEGDCINYVELAQREGNQPLINWLRTQQYEYKKFKEGQPTFLTQERYLLLEELQMDWNWNRTTSTRQKLWMKQYQLLQDYKNQHNHTRVTVQQNKSLAIWIKNQKAAYKKYVLHNNSNATAILTNMTSSDPNDLSQQRIKNLHLFHSLIHHDSIHETNWMKFYQQYKKATMNQPPKTKQNQTTSSSSVMMSMELQKWILAQRQMYKQYQKYGTSGTMNLERLQLLKDINFDFNGQPRSSHENTIKWERILSQLQAYNEQYGDLAVPTSHPDLGNWVHNIRAEYRRSKVPPDKVKMLDSIGFIWNVHEYHWNKKYKSLLKFYEKHGHTNVPMVKSNATMDLLDINNNEKQQQCEEIISLGCWVQSQRQWYRRQMISNKKKTKKSEPESSSKENKGRLVKLNQIFGAQNVQQYTQQYDAKWDEMFQQMIDFQSKHGHCLVPRTYKANPKLANWVSAQRKQYQTSKIPLSRRSKLQGIGFVWSVPRGPKKSKKKTETSVNSSCDE